MSERLPAMRQDLEFIPIQHGGQEWILIRDHLGLVQEGKALSPDTYRIMTLLDGERGVTDLQAFLMRRGGGALVTGEEVKGFIRNLDEACLLDSERFWRARAEVVARFMAMPVRPCSHGGHAYPGEPGKLRCRLEEILSLYPGEGSSGGTRALVVPHIDLSVGGKGYSAYRMLKGASPERVVLLGVGHHLAHEMFSLTEKDFETPLGVARCDKALVRELQGSCRGILAADDFVHRSEHSIEFQVLFLQHLLPENSFTILPILCGSIQPSVPGYCRADYLEKAGPFLRALRKILGEEGERTLLIAGVDLCHIGPKFGHTLPAGHLEARARTHDASLLEALCSQNADLFWEESIRVRDGYNVCGFPALACLLEVLPRCAGRVVHHEMWHEEATRSAVSFAAAVFSGE